MSNAAEPGASAAHGPCNVHRRSATLLPKANIAVRRLQSDDAPALVPLLHAYMKEVYDASWNGSPAALRTDALGQRCTMHVALQRESIVGFLAWVSSYDLHHCVAGAEVLDLYVAPALRSRGVALQLGCAAAAEIYRAGGLYFKGGVVNRGAGPRLYSRFGVCDGASCIVSGRAFRRLAELANSDVRDIARSLPEHAWNFEA